MNFQMIRVISSPSISTTGFMTFIFDMCLNLGFGLQIYVRVRYKKDLAKKNRHWAVLDSSYASLIRAFLPRKFLK